MTDTPSSILLLRLQSLGSNTNLWGGYLNTAMQTLEQASKGVQSLVVTGDATITWTNYTTGNTGQCAVLRLTGSPAAAATLTFPGYQNWLVVTNATGKTVTIKCSGGTGVGVPTGTSTLLFCDATDYYSSASTWANTYATPLTNSGDIVVKTTLETAIAAASGLTAPFILNSAADTTPGYLGQKVTGSGAVVISTTSPGGNEKTNIAVGALALTAGAIISATGTTAAVNTRYQVNKATSYTITLPAAPAQGDVVQFELYGSAGLTTFGLNSLKYYGSTTNPTTTGQGVQTFIYTTAATGWVDA